MQSLRALCLLCLTLSAASLTGCRGLLDNVVTVVPPPATDRERLDIRQVRTELTGQPPAAVAASVGTPDRTSVSGDREWWMYYDRFHDPVAGADLPNVTFRFRHGVVEAVTY
jgi:hypothetical protein